MDLDILKQLVALGVDEVSKFLEFQKFLWIVCTKKYNACNISSKIFITSNSYKVTIARFVLWTIQCILMKIGSTLFLN
jgi:hypothetical protein